VDRPTAHARFATDLLPFLPPRHRRCADGVSFGCDGTSSLGHVVQAFGVPLTEVGGLTANGQPVSAACRPAGGDLIDVGQVGRPQALPSRQFLLDVHLGTLARQLRLVGVDTAYANDNDDDDLIEQANVQHRVLLTKDRGLLCRRSLWLGGYVRGSSAAEQLEDVLARFAPPLEPWTRCVSCNGLLSVVPKAAVSARLLPGTRRTYQAFSRCESCGQVYWRGAHWARLDAVVALAQQVVAAVDGMPRHEPVTARRVLA
jgi:uncharacterized protein